MLRFPRSASKSLILLLGAGLLTLGGCAKQASSPEAAPQDTSFDSMTSQMASGSGMYAESRDDTDGLSAADDFESKAYTDAYLNSPTTSSNDSNALPVLFKRACEPGRRVVIGAVGDVLLHQPLAEQGMKSSNGFHSLWSDMESELKRVSVMYANLEGPTAGAVSSIGRIVADPGQRFDRVAYTSYPLFNYNPELVGDLRASGIDIVSTANNHAMDRRAIGVERTIEQLKKIGMPFTGTRSASTAASTSAEKTDWTTVTEADGFKIGWVACSFSTNGNPDPTNLVLLCFENRSIVLNEIRRLRADPTIDAVIVTPHWGVEYTHVPGNDQRKLAQDMIDAGALVVFGNHPHVLQPVDKITAKDGHEGYVIYSLGNFVSGQKGVAKRTSAMIYLGLTKNAKGEVFVNGARHMPLTMTYTSAGLMVRPAKGNLEDSRTLANRILSRSREISPGEALVTNPECK
jgi:hypothetical protein